MWEILVSKLNFGTLTIPKKCIFCGKKSHIAPKKYFFTFLDKKNLLNTQMLNLNTQLILKSIKKGRGFLSQKFSKNWEIQIGNFTNFTLVLFY